MSKRSIVCFFLALLIGRDSAAQEIIRLWDGQPRPYYKINSVEEREGPCWKVTCVFDVTDPTLTVYRASGKNSGRAVIVLPGGGYEAEAIYHEGYDVARALSGMGITAAVLKYRLPHPETSDSPERVPLSDVRRAIQLLRSRSETYGIHTGKVGFMGFSAGGHLATAASVWKAEQPEQEPDFSALIYGVSQLTTENREWLEKSLYFRKLTEAEVRQNTTLERLSGETPPRLPGARNGRHGVPLHRIHPVRRSAVSTGRRGGDASVREGRSRLRSGPRWRRHVPVDRAGGALDQATLSAALRGSSTSTISRRGSAGYPAAPT